jgi:hypothetical protein
MNMNALLFLSDCPECGIDTLILVIGYVLCGLIGLLGIAILWRIADNSIDLSRLISEANGDASMSRFQFLVFTFVISLSLFLVIAAGKPGQNKPGLPDSIPAGILTLLGISGSSYAVGKAISYSDPAGLEEQPVTVTISPATVTLKYGQKQQFSTTITRDPDAKVKWEIVAGATGAEGSNISDAGLFSAPNAPSTPPAPHATVKATLIDYPDVSDLAVVTFMEDRPSMVTIAPPAPMKYGTTQTLIAQVTPPQTGVRLLWEVVPGATGTEVGKIDANGNLTAPNAGPQAVPQVTVKVSLADYPNITDIAVVKLTA